MKFSESRSPSPGQDRSRRSQKNATNPTGSDQEVGSIPLQMPQPLSSAPSVVQQWSNPAASQPPVIQQITPQQSILVPTVQSMLLLHKSFLCILIISNQITLAISIKIPQARVQ